jgi:hypothetical protein
MGSSTHGLVDPDHRTWMAIEELLGALRATT